MRYERRKPFLKKYKNYSIQCRGKFIGNTIDNEYVIKYTGDHIPRQSKIRSEMLDRDRVWWSDPARKGRDYQKKRLYAAERKALVKKHQVNFKDHLAASRFIAKVISNKWFIDNFMIREVIMHHDHRRFVHARGGGAYRPTRTGWIKIPKWACNNWVILHELAHCCQEHPEGHGRNFCYIYLLLIEKFIGKEAARDLKKQYAIHNVQHWIFGTSEPHIQEFIANGNCPF